MKNNDISWQFSEDTLISIIERIVQRKTELDKELNIKTDYNIGLLDGYTQCIDMIKNDLEGRGFNVEDFGIK
ncbi:hypothetical protein HMPREF3181_01014 [Parvimonas sp. KA00067]|uniref:hypothetical protein n=1 Tax=Parvimonas sp. KA00067 TaxID=1588755 RepID=UPI000796A50D|nr:hypothetical protein [Parvimonas sp. KA00067]KXB65922.1 hypothetical protein HMPREF3181_01014 [Parvimonas sp. KA00067]